MHDDFSPIHHVGRPARRNVTMLNDVPPELLELILEKLDTTDLNATSRVSKYFNTLSEPQLYRHVIVLHGATARRLALALQADGRRIASIRTLLVSVKHSEDDGLELLPPWIPLVSYSVLMLVIKLTLPDV
jgi:hypothetical protein